MEAAQSDQIPSEVAFGRRDRDAARCDRYVAADRSPCCLERDVVGGVPLGVDHTDPAVDRDLHVAFDDEVLLPRRDLPVEPHPVGDSVV